MECSICKSVILSDVSGRVVSSCGHMHHVYCIMSWFAQRKLHNLTPNCPLCRAEFFDLESVPNEQTQQIQEQDPIFILILNINIKALYAFLLAYALYWCM